MRGNVLIGMIVLCVIVFYSALPKFIMIRNMEILNDINSEVRVNCETMRDEIMADLATAEKCITLLDESCELLRDIEGSISDVKKCFKEVSTRQEYICSNKFTKDVREIEGRSNMLKNRFALRNAVSI